MLQHTLLIHIVTGNHIVYFFRTTTHTYIMFMGRSPMTIMFLEPVCIRIRSSVFLPVSRIVSNSTRSNLSLLVSNDTIHYFLTELQALSTINTGCIKITCKIIRVHHFRNLQRIRETDIIIVVDRYFTALT